MRVEESYRATIGRLHVMSVFNSIGQVTLSKDSKHASNLSERDVEWLLENTDARVVKVRVSVEEIRITELIKDEK